MHLTKREKDLLKIIHMTQTSMLLPLLYLPKREKKQPNWQNKCMHQGVMYCK